MEGRERDATTLTGEVKLGSRLKIVDPFIAELSRRARSAAKPHIEAARLAAARPSGIEHRIVARLVIPRYSPGKRTEEHTSELQSLMRISSAVFCLKKKNTTPPDNQ